MGAEERGDGTGVSIGTLEQMGGHDPAGSGIVDGGLLGRSLQFLKGGHRNGEKNRQANRW